MKLSLLSNFLYFFAFVWLIFAIFWFFRESEFRYFYTAIGSTYALIMAILAYFVSKKKMWAWWIAIVFVGFNTLVSVFDEVGLVDLAFIGASIILFVILLKGKPLIAKNSKNHGKNK